MKKILISLILMICICNNAYSLPIATTAAITSAAAANSARVARQHREQRNTKKNQISGGLYGLIGKELKGLKHNHKVIYTELDQGRFRILMIGDDYKIRTVHISMGKSYENMDVIEKQIFELLYNE